MASTPGSFLPSVEALAGLRGFRSRARLQSAAAQAGWKSRLAKWTGGQGNPGHGRSGRPGYGTIGGTDQADPIAIDFDSDGALQKGNGNDQAVTLLGLDENSFEPVKTAMVDANEVSDLDEGPGLSGQPGLDDRVDGLDFLLIGRDRNLANSDDVYQAWGGQNGEPAVGTETAEDIAGKKRQIKLLGAVRPGAAGAVKRQKLLIALVLEDGGGGLFAMRPDAMKTVGTSNRNGVTYVSICQ